MKVSNLKNLKLHRNNILPTISNEAMLGKIQALPCEHRMLQAGQLPALL